MLYVIRDHCQVAWGSEVYTIIPSQVHPTPRAEELPTPVNAREVTQVVLDDRGVSAETRARDFNRLSR